MASGIALLMSLQVHTRSPDASVLESIDALPALRMYAMVPAQSSFISISVDRSCLFNADNAILASHASRFPKELTLEEMSMKVRLTSGDPDHDIDMRLTQAFVLHQVEFLLLLRPLRRLTGHNGLFELITVRKETLHHYDT